MTLEEENAALRAKNAELEALIEGGVSRRLASAACHGSDQA